MVTEVQYRVDLITLAAELPERSLLG